MAEYDLIERNKIFEKVTDLYRYSNGDMHIAYRELLDYILDMPSAEVQPVDRWINAQTNPPIATDGETSDYVLVLRASGRQCVCYYVYDDDEGNYWCSEDEKSIYDIDEITRWQPLPKPPNE